MPDDSYNDGYTHEALHTTHVLMETFDLERIRPFMAESARRLAAALH